MENKLEQGIVYIAEEDFGFIKLNSDFYDRRSSTDRYAHVNTEDIKFEKLSKDRTRKILQIDSDDITYEYNPGNNGNCITAGCLKNVDDENELYEWTKHLGLNGFVSGSEYFSVGDKPIFNVEEPILTFVAWKVADAVKKGIPYKQNKSDGFDNVFPCKKDTDKVKALKRQAMKDFDGYKGLAHWGFMLSRSGFIKVQVPDKDYDCFLIVLNLEAAYENLKTEDWTADWEDNGNAVEKLDIYISGAYAGQEVLIPILAGPAFDYGYYY